MGLGVVASLVVHGVVFAVLSQWGHAPDRPHRTLSPSRPAMVWLRDAPAAVAAAPKAAPAAQLKVRVPKPVAVAAVELLPAAAVRVAEVPAPVTGVEFAPPPIALGTPAPRRWVQPPEAVQPPPGWAAMAQAAQAAQEAQRRQVMAALQRQAAQAEARCPTHEPQRPDCEREAQ